MSRGDFGLGTVTQVGWYLGYLFLVL